MGYSVLACGEDSSEPLKKQEIQRNREKVALSNGILLPLSWRKISILDSGTELVGKNIPSLATGCGAIRKPRKAKASPAACNETLKKKGLVSTPLAA